MNDIKLWESNFKDNYVYFNSVSELYKYLKENNLPFNPLVKKDYTPGSITETFLDDNAQNHNTHLIYTDESHPIALVASSVSIFRSFINPTFFEENKEEFIKYAKEEFDNTIHERNRIITIPDYIYNTDLLKEVLNSEENKKAYIVLQEINNEINLTDEEIKLIKDNHRELSISRRTAKTDKVCTEKIIGRYTKQDIEELKSITISENITDKEIESLKLVQGDCLVSIQRNFNDKENEETYLAKIKYILNILKNHKRNYNIKIFVNNRELLRQSNIINELSKNINMTINSDSYDYDLATFKEEEFKIEYLISPIRNSNLSPFEKFLAAYNIAKQFKQYKENTDNPQKARLLHYILDNDNEYIVCAGFAALLKELLNRLGISSKSITVSVDTSYDNGYTKDNTKINLSYHERLLIRIDDDKYNIHGYYLVDSTWDNDMYYDLYLNALMTFNRKKEARRLEELSNTDLLLDFNNIEDFKTKINYFFKKESNKSYTEDYINKAKNKYQKLIDSTSDNKERLNYMKKRDNEIAKIRDYNYIYAYQTIFSSIMDILKSTDYPKYLELYNKYYDKLYNHDLPLKDIEHIMNQATAEYADYIIPLVNNEVSLDTILEAAKVVMKEIEGYHDDELDEWYEETKEINEKIAKSSFPYKYDQSNKTEAYLETAPDAHIR